MSMALKVKFVDFPSDYMKNMTIPILEKHFGAVEECDQPDFLFYSVFGHKHLDYDCVRIFWTGENIQPDFNVCDYAIGFGHIQFEDRYQRIPLYYFYDLDYQRAIHKHLVSPKEIYTRDKFCNFLYSNASASIERENFFNLLSKYKKIDSGGKFLNNMDGKLIEDKYEFQRHYKFSIAFENSSTSGYTTEKILQAFAAGTIPIYWGNPRIADDFCSDSFINCHEYGDFEEVIEKIKEIDNDDELFAHYIQTPIGTKDKFPEDPLRQYENYLTHICSQPKENAYRRNNVFWGKYYQEEMKNKFLVNTPIISKKDGFMDKIKKSNTMKGIIGKFSSK